MCEISKSRQKQQLSLKYGLLRHIKQLRCVRSSRRDEVSFNYLSCCTSSRGQYGVVEFMRNSGSGTGAFNGLNHCGNVWACPVCATKIARKRHDEVSAAITGFNELTSGGVSAIAMLTLTFSHCAKDNLSDLLCRLNDASAFLWSSGGFVREMKRAGLVGKISSFEVTCSRKNGWHPHKHFLLFFNGSSAEFLKGLESTFADYWLRALEHAGLRGNDHALSLDPYRGDGKYLSKLADEMTLSHVKRGRGILAHYAPFQLADLSMQGDKWARLRFCEYVSAFRGKHQLYWSKGLKVKLGIVEVSDKSASEAVDPGYTEVLRVSSGDFKRLYDGGHDYRPDVLYALGKGDVNCVLNILRICNVRIVPYLYFDDYGGYSRFDLFDDYCKAQEPCRRWLDWCNKFKALGDQACFVKPDMRISSHVRF